MEDLDVRRNRMLREAPEGVDTTTAADAEAEDRLDAKLGTPSRRVQILIAAAVLIAVVVVVWFVLMSPRRRRSTSPPRPRR